MTQLAHALAFDHGDGAPPHTSCGSTGSAIGHIELAYLGYNFQASGKPAAEEALEHLRHLARCHRKRTQQLA